MRLIRPRSCIISPTSSSSLSYWASYKKEEQKDEEEEEENTLVNIITKGEESCYQESIVRRNILEAKEDENCTKGNDEIQKIRLLGI